MKNKKGFTLIELLAVIVILAIIAIIAVPIILNVIEKSKESSAVDSAYGYIHALEEGIVEAEVNDNILVENKEYNDLREFETNYDINVKGNKPTKGTFILEKRQVVYAEFVIDGYNVVCERGKCEAKGKTELITITYDPDGGTSDKTSERISSGTTTELPNATKEHYGLEGWYLENEKVNNQTVFNESVTLVAHWIKDSYTITFDAGEGTPSENTKTVEHGENLGELPSCTAPEGYTFNGWYTEREGGEEIEEDRTFTESTTLYAHYTKNIYTVTYNAGSGSVTPTSVTVEHGNTIELPTPTPPANYSFIGWYTEQNGSGTKITNSTPIPSTRTLYAYYEQTTFNFAYTGSVQTFIASKNGKYKLEVWGAQGGSTHVGSYIGGYGGYSVGNITLSANTSIYVVVGGQGDCNNDSNKVSQRSPGGYNGGGGATPMDSVHYMCSGGGATHIATTNRGELRNYSSYQSEVIIVAGGGGGAGNNAGYGGSVGGQGGGIEGAATVNGCTDCGTKRPATQTAAGYGRGGSGGFGYGAGSTSGQRCGAGGGWYGGGTDSYEWGGGGGSGYIASSSLLSSNGVTKHMACYSCTASTVESTYTNNVTCYNGNAQADCAKSGTGYARITYIGE